MSNTSIAVAAIIVLLLVAAAGLALHPQSPLTIIYLFPDDIYHGWRRLFYTRDDNHRRPHSPKPAPLNPNLPINPTNPPNGYIPSLPPRFPVDPNSKPIPADPHPNIPAHRGFPVNPNGNITPSPNPSFLPIEHHSHDLHPFGFA